MRRRATLAAFAVCGTLVGPVVATAQSAQGFDAQTFSPAPRQRDGHLSLLAADTPDELAWEIGAVLNFAFNPLIIDFETSGAPAGSLPDSVDFISSQLALHVHGAVALVGRLELGFQVPVILFQDSGLDDPAAARFDFADGGGIGAPELSAKLTLLDTGAEDEAGFALAVAGSVVLPLGDPDRFQSDDGLSGAGQVLATMRTASQLRATLNVGYRVRPTAEFLNVTIDDQLTYGLGVLIPTGEAFAIGLEVNGALTLQADELGPEEAPLEAILLGRYRHESGLYLTAAAGAGLVTGAGTPDVRGLLGFGYGGRTVAEVIDLCPGEEEDFDGYMDDDGCPDPDNDGDGILDVHDRCPDEPGPAGNRGCPLDESSIIDYVPSDQQLLHRTDSDGDGVLDIDDLCPHEPEDLDGYQDLDGCPEPGDGTGGDPSTTDSDGDGIMDDIDFCPNEPEDFDGVFDEDGCPEDDGDGDGIPDEIDDCPMIPGPLGSDDGCP